jgi:hypothetical protein
MSAIGPSRKTARGQYNDVSAPDAIGRALAVENNDLRAENARLTATISNLQAQLSAERSQCISKVQFYKGKLEETRDLIVTYHALVEDAQRKLA